MSNEKTLLSLSNLADGHATEQELDALLRAWNEDPALRRDWQALHLAGEALRTPDLGAPAQSSEALLANLRERIATEPVQLRPRRVTRWLPPLGVAAGFVLLALLVPRLTLPGVQAPLVVPDPSAQALVTVPGSRTFDANSSFVQTIVAPEQPGLVAENHASQHLLSAAPPFPTPNAASATRAASAAVIH